MKSNVWAKTACKASRHQPRVTPWVIITGRCTTAACKAKRSIIYIMLLPFQGVFTHTHNDPGCCPGLRAHWPFFNFAACKKSPK